MKVPKEFLSQRNGINWYPYTVVTYQHGARVTLDKDTLEEVMNLFEREAHGDLSVSLIITPNGKVFEDKLFKAFVDLENS